MAEETIPWEITEVLDELPPLVRTPNPYGQTILAHMMTQTENLVGRPQPDSSEN